jgi:hypothetical protein
VVLVRRGIGYDVPVTDLLYLEDTAIHLMLANRPVKLMAAYISPKLHLMESELTE